jgi:ketopantoate reductase
MDVLAVSGDQGDDRLGPVGAGSVGQDLAGLVHDADLDRILVVVEADVDSYLGHGLLLRSEDGVMDTFRVNAAVVPRQEQQAFIPIYGGRPPESS